MATSQTAADLSAIGPLQLRIMKFVWKHGPTTVKDVHSAMNAEPGAPQLAYTTFLTVMRNLARRKFLDQQKNSQRSHLFVPLIDEPTYKNRVVGAMLDGLFEGSAGSFIETIKSLATLP